MLRCFFALALIDGALTCAIAQSSANDCRERYRKELEANANSSLVHYRIAECLWKLKDRMGAANEFRTALSGDLKPPWIEVWSHINLGRIFDASSQRERALNEYRMAEATQDNTNGAQDRVAGYKRSAYREP